MVGKSVSIIKGLTYFYKRFLSEAKYPAGYQPTNSGKVLFLYWSSHYAKTA